MELGGGVPPRPAVRRGFASGSGEVLLAFGPFVGVTHPTVDTRLQYDPDWRAATDNATRWEEGYVSGQWRCGEAFFGILDRNWGPRDSRRPALGRSVQHGPSVPEHRHRARSPRGDRRAARSRRHGRGGGR